MPTSGWPTLGVSAQKIAALADLAEQPEDLEGLLALRALTDPLAVYARSNLSLVPPEDRYLGPRASVVMAPFLIIGQSRFSPGTYGVFYTADAFIVAVRESSYHAARYLRAAGFADPIIVPRYELQLTLDDSDHLDIRSGGADDVQAFGARARASGRQVFGMTAFDRQAALVTRPSSPSQFEM